jgi:hypothetical protein
MHFPRALKVKLEDDGKVTLSIRITDESVSVHRFELSDFRVMVAEFESQTQQAASKNK